MGDVVKDRPGVSSGRRFCRAMLFFAATVVFLLIGEVVVLPVRIEAQVLEHLQIFFHGLIQRGQVIAHHQRARAGIGYLPQEPSVFRRMSVEDNVMALLETRPDLDAAARVARREALLADLRIEHVRQSPGLALSGGERRRVEIARALAANPRFMLLDEPFAGVDPISVMDIQRIIGELARRGIGILITDHNVRETLAVCHRSYIIGEGKVIASGAAEEILANPRVREVYLGESFRL